jgi:soluble lytic murein transglycosylase-like protein
VTEALARKRRYDGLIHAELSAAGLPASLIYLAMHESRFDTLAVSAVGARGLWQLMPQLASEFEMSVPADWRNLPPQKDPRTQPGLATRAGVGQLRKLYERYHDPFLAMAAYNSGESQLNTALRRLKSAPGDSVSPLAASTTRGGPAVQRGAQAADTLSPVDEAIARVADVRFRSDYWYLQRMNLLPAETLRYVPRIVATMVAAQDLGE